MGIIEQMLAKYEISTGDDMINALKEIFQEIALLGLYRSDFFSKAAFYGGTALRILYGLNRFSEDMDFTLLTKNESFNIEHYFKNIKDEFSAFGIEVILNKKIKNDPKNKIASAFIKNDTLIHTLEFKEDNLRKIVGDVYSGKKLKIKIEVDTSPPLRYATEVKTILFPVTFNIVSMTLPNLFAGKMHAVLFRNWRNRVKGRDWFDFEWFVKQNIHLNLTHLQERMLESSNLGINQNLDEKYFKEMVYNRIDNLNVEQAKQEVKPFIKDSSVLEFWTKDYFRFLVDRIKFRVQPDWIEKVPLW